MTMAERIYREAQLLPDELAREVLDFIGYIEARYDLKSAMDRDLQEAQQGPLERVWANPTDDEVWNDL